MNPTQGDRLAEAAAKFRLLVHSGFLTARELMAAIEESVRTQASVESVLRRRHHISAHSLEFASRVHERLNIPGWVYAGVRVPVARVAPVARDAQVLRTAVLGTALLLLPTILQDDATRAFHPRRIGALIMANSPEEKLTEVSAAAAARRALSHPSADFPAHPGGLSALHQPDAAVSVPLVVSPLAADEPLPPPPVPPSPPPVPPSPPHLGNGELAHAQDLAAATGVSLEVVLALRESGLGWGNVAHELGTTLGRAIQAGRGVGSSAPGAAAGPAGNGGGAGAGSPRQAPPGRPPSGHKHNK